MGLVDEAEAERLTGHQCHVQKMMDGINSTSQAEPLTWDEFHDALTSEAKSREIARALRKRYAHLGIVVPNDQTVGRHRRGECQACK